MDNWRIKRALLRSAHTSTTPQIIRAPWGPMRWDWDGPTSRVPSCAVAVLNYDMCARMSVLSLPISSCCSCSPEEVIAASTILATRRYSLREQIAAGVAAWDQRRRTRQRRWRSPLQRRRLPPTRPPRASKAGHRMTHGMGLFACCREKRIGRLRLVKLPGGRPACQGSKQTRPMCLSSSSVEKIYPIDSPVKKRKSQYELVDPRLLSLKYKSRKRLSLPEDESVTTESIGCDGFFISKNSGTDMVSIPEELDSCENTLSIFGGCIEVDSKNGIENQSMRKMFEARLSGSSSSSNNFSSDASCSRSTGTKETESWIMHGNECCHPDLVLQQHDNDLDRMYDVLEQYGDIMDGELAGGDIHGSASHVMDEKLYSNGVDDFQILPTGQTSSHGEKKLTIDQEFEQYFSRLML